MILDPKPLFDWANKRESIRRLKDAGEPGPWTDDSILREFRFCNVYREEDRVTKQFKAMVRDPYAESPSLWIMILLMRIINWPDTIEAIIKDTISGWPVPNYNGAKVSATMNEYKQLHSKVYTGAYMVRAEANKNCEWYTWPKERYVAEIVVGGAWKRRGVIEQSLLERNPLEAFVSEIVKCYGIGPFIAYQVGVDLTWCPGWLDGAEDLNTWAMCGPGTTRGLNRLAGRQVSARPKSDILLAELAELYEAQEFYTLQSMPHIRLSDITNCCCAFDKYERVRLGEGRPRSKYVEGRGC
ncbi:MAG: hypothetical protein DRP42_06560 [Tenericutes bacterium]|nr:MAG: hypothetical protein DRP42_06560 [Mycoplasmatota bacterium]